MSELPITPESETIATDLACIKCGYNLRTMQVHGRCPECGTEVVETMNALSTPSPTLGRWLLGIAIIAGLAPYLLLAFRLSLRHIVYNRQVLPVGPLVFLGIPAAVELGVLLVCSWLVVRDRKSSVIPVGVLVISALFSSLAALSVLWSPRYGSVMALLVGLGIVILSFAVTVRRTRRIGWTVLASLGISALASTFWGWRALFSIAAANA